MIDPMGSLIFVIAFALFVGILLGAFKAGARKSDAGRPHIHLGGGIGSHEDHGQPGLSSACRDDACYAMAAFFVDFFRDGDTIDDSSCHGYLFAGRICGAVWLCGNQCYGFVSDLYMIPNTEKARVALIKSHPLLVFY